MVAPKLHSLAIELTGRCNQKCDYCYNGWRADDGASIGEATTEELLARARAIFDAFDVDHVTLTGGEPFARGDVWQLLDLARERGVGVQIISNGGMITERIAERLAPYGVYYVQVTLNGPEPALHAEHVGGAGHFERTLAGIRALSAAGVPVVGCVVVTRKNARRVGEILALFESLGVRRIALSRFSPAGYAVAQAAALLPALGDVTAALAQALPFARERGFDVSCTMPIPPCMLAAEDYAPIAIGTCPIGTDMQELALGPDGRLRNCTLHAEALGGDVLAMADVAAALTTAARKDYHKKLPAFCEGCLHAPTCGGGCGAAAEWLLGLADGRRLPDPFLWQHVDDDFAARLERERGGKRRLELVG